MPSDGWLDAMELGQERTETSVYLEDRPDFTDSKSLVVLEDLFDLCDWLSILDFREDYRRGMVEWLVSVKSYNIPSSGLQVR